MPLCQLANSVTALGRIELTYNLIFLVFSRPPKQRDERNYVNGQSVLS